MENVTKKIISISVKNLVEYGFQKGDLRTGLFLSSSRAVLGTKIHQKIQNSRNEFYEPEVTVKYLFSVNDFEIMVQGRIDGIFNDDESKPIIEEIKTTVKDLAYLNNNPNILHIAQLKFYSYIIAKQRGLESIKSKLTYFNIESKKILEIDNEYSVNELELYVKDLLNKYADWAGKINSYLLIRDESIQNLEFPFGEFRKGQRDLSKYVYRSIRDESDLFVQAPTGIGKTIGVIFPALKAMERGFGDRIFYLTAKTIGRVVADKTFDILRENGLVFKTIMLTSKEKICFQEEVNCDPEECPFAKGYYDRVNYAIADIFRHYRFNRELIEKYARKYGICPFEFSLDLAIWSDCIICDYNYAFDPRVYLKRFFESNSDRNIFLIDEAHNLPNRSREMFSSEFEKTDILRLKNNLGENLPKLSTVLRELNKLLIDKRKISKERDNFYTEEKPDEKISSKIKKILSIAEKWLGKNIKTDYRKQLLEIYFILFKYFKISNEYNSGYVTYYDALPKNNLKIKLFCIDPSIMLKSAFLRAKSKIFFSATLLPMNYFQEILTGKYSLASLILPSPFPRENLKIILNYKIETTYKKRELYYQEIAELIGKFILENKINNLVFFPSYKFLNEIYERISQKEPELNIIVQSPGMIEKEKIDFLNKFDFNKKITGFVVMGGIFGEGIDLSGDKLGGAIIVGVGLPRMSKERNLIQDYYEAKNNRGFEFAYQIPGLNRVFQAMGRVIRSDKDKGKILLIDRRFSNYSYKKFFPPEWKY